jgi:two-component system sensor histidine kinase UhpB
MRPRTLLTQLLVVNLLLIAAAVIAASIATNPQSELRDDEAAGLVLGFSVALTVAINLFLLSRRIRPLERLADEMEQTSLSDPTRTVPDSVGGPEEVQRLEQSFRRMLDRLEAERRYSAHAALDAQESERARVARDLHDEVNQSLTGLVLRIEAMRTHAPPEFAAELAETREVAGQAMKELLALARQLRPTALDDLGLDAALGGLVEDSGRASGIETSFESEGELGTLPDDVQLVTYRIAQEAMSNAIRHAKASSVRVNLSRDADGLELRITDDGAGLDPKRVGTGLGLAGMRERALLVGGRLELESRPPLGTRVRLTVPAADDWVEMT